MTAAPSDSARADRVAARRGYSGPALLEQGFRPFFVAAGAWAALSLALWIGMLTGRVALPIAFDPVTWHAHGLLFGFVGAAIAGFLLTAVPNWTGRLPVRGLPLAGLALLWLAGRVAVATGAWIGPVAAAAVDLAFWLVLATAMAREILAGNNRREPAGRRRRGDVRRGQTRWSMPVVPSAGRRWGRWACAWASPSRSC